jgi:hypothetical protein
MNRKHRKHTPVQLKAASTNHETSDHMTNTTTTTTTTTTNTKTNTTHKPLGQHVKRARFWGVWVLAMIATILLFWTDADHGLYTALFLTTLLTGSIALAYSHLLRKAMLDYIDLREYAIIAKGHPTAAGLVVLAVSILMVGLLNLFGGLIHDFSNANSGLPMTGVLHD